MITKESTFSFNFHNREDISERLGALKPKSMVSFKRGGKFQPREAPQKSFIIL